MLNAELLNLLIPAAAVIGGYFLRHWMGTPQPTPGPVVPTPAPPVIPMPAPTPVIPGPQPTPNDLVQQLMGLLAKVLQDMLAKKATEPNTPTPAIPQPQPGEHPLLPILLHLADELKKAKDSTNSTPNPTK